MGVPVLLIGFNRPDLLEKTLSSIQAYYPDRLYVFVDGAREGDPKDEALVDQSRQIVLGGQWAKSTATLFPENNLGVKYGPSKAINWFFSEVDAGVVLEDDCVPSLNFFRFAEDFLSDYQESENVWGFSGSNPKNLAVDDEWGHFFIRHPHTWGWGTWSDRWAKLDLELEGYKSAKARQQLSWPSSAHKLAFSRLLDSMVETGMPKTWDFQWAWTVMANRGLWGISSSHMVKNLGFRDDATHTSRQIYRETEYGDEVRFHKKVDPHADLKLEEVMLKTFQGLKSPAWVSALENYLKRALARLRQFAA